MKRIMRISTRGYYDLTSGNTLKNDSYYLYPKNDFKKLTTLPEITIMVHGLRNNNAGAIAKVILAKKQLRKLGYVHPVIGFSYDSNVTGAHLAKYAKHSLIVGQKIAKKNGKNLGKFIEDFKMSCNSKIKIRLMGHSLGSQVILSALEYLDKKKKNTGIVTAVYFFGASITRDVPSSNRYGPILQNVVEKKIVNYYAPNDEVLAWADKQKYVKDVLGLDGILGKPIPKYRQKLTKPKNHRFASYVCVLNSFP